MPAVPKATLDKQAWQWADSVDTSGVTREHVRLVYRLNLAPCQTKYCKRNCKGNPFCLQHLGEKKWLTTIDKSKQQTFDANDYSRMEGEFVGLKNLGATCYVNTFLQLAFHNKTLRRAVYEWRAPDMPEQYCEGWRPKVDSVCENLQVIFALLQHSKRRFIDPGPLIDCLGLDAGEQQDAQEFSKLFLNVLERNLYGKDSGKKNLIEEQFTGRHCCITKCQKCGSESESPGSFSELQLNIKGHQTLAQCMRNYLQEEKLEGDNQYMCNVCNSKQNATLTIKLKSLPPVLNLQLLRFVFDKTKGHKKKLSNFIQFPESLDMTPYLDAGGDNRSELTTLGDNTYKLTAVLIHSGVSAYSGHYTTHIRDQETGSWYTFNDENTEKVNNKKLELGKEDDPTDASSDQKVQKSLKGHYGSRNAYMLVYQKCTANLQGEDQLEETVPGSLLPAVVQGYVANDNEKFKYWIRDQKKAKEISMQEARETQEEVKNLYFSLPVQSLNQPWEWVSTDWLVKWLADPSKADKQDNLISLCPHGHLLPEDVSKVKCVSSEGAAFLFAKYSVSQHYPGESLLCEKCVVQKCHEIQLRNCMTDDDKLFNCCKNNNVNVCNRDELFWVSTKHLRSWKKFAIGEMGASPPIGQIGLDDDQEEYRDLLATSINDLSPTKNGSRTNHYNQLNNFPSEPSHGSLSAWSPPNQSPSQEPSYDCGRQEHSQQCRNAEFDCVFGLHLPQRNSSSQNLCNPCGEYNNTVPHNCEFDKMDCDESPDSSTQGLVKADNDDNMGDESGDDKLSPVSSSMDVSENHLCARVSSTTNTGPTGQSVSGGGDQGRDKKEEFVQNDNDDGFCGREDKFNDDILCEHGNLRIDESGRRLVPSVVWKRLLHYFPYLKPFTNQCEVCDICMIQQQEEQQFKLARRLAGQDQKDVLSNLYHNKNRPKVGENWEGRSAYIVSSNFLEGWRKFVKQAVKNDSVQEIVNAPLICEHNLLIYKLQDMNSPDNVTRFTLVWQDEWEKLISYFRFDVEISVVQYTEVDGQLNIVTLPDVCSCCLNERLKMEEEGRFIFNHQIVYVRRVLDGDSDGQRVDEFAENGKGYSYDPEFNAPAQQKNRGTCPPPEKQLKLDDGVVRKSTRHRKTRGEKELIVSSSMRLKELKFLLFHEYGVPAFDQNLTLDGRALKNDDATLQDLRVYPLCVVFLKADEPSGDVTSSIDAPSRPEEGFKGTNLLGR